MSNGAVSKCCHCIKLLFGRRSEREEHLIDPGDPMREIVREEEHLIDPGDPMREIVRERVRALVGGGTGEASRTCRFTSGQFIPENEGTLEDFYTLERDASKTLGKGNYGTVMKATHVKSKAVRAVKEIWPVDHAHACRTIDEIAIMKTLDHPNIIKLCESFRDGRCIYLVMELCEGGDLFTQITEVFKDTRFTERQAAIVMKQITHSIFYLHSENICHRDVKPENFIFVSKNKPIEANTLKLIDFGITRKVPVGEMLHGSVGTPYYVAPEVLRGGYDHTSDLWSCGVIMYILLCGHPPFPGKNSNGATADQILAAVRRGKFTFPDEEWSNISDDAKELINQLLRMSPQERFTADQTLHHPWIHREAPHSIGTPIAETFVDNLRAFQSHNKLKKAALHIIAREADDDQIAESQKLFESLDKNCDGKITPVDLEDGLKRSGLKIPQDLQALLGQIDTDCSCVMDYTEFLAAAIGDTVYMQEQVCYRAFCVLDRNGDGFISLKELYQALQADGGGSTPQEISELMEELDITGNGSIDFEEFMEMMRGGHRNASCSKVNLSTRSLEDKQQRTKNVEAQVASRSTSGQLRRAPIRTWSLG